MSTSNESLAARQQQAIKYLGDRFKGKRPKAVVTLGSGLGDAIKEWTVVDKIPYSEIPGFPVSTVKGHQGTLAICNPVLGGKKSEALALVMQGRFHYYEGFSMQELTLPLRVFGQLGTEVALLSCAAGGIGEGYQVGDLMIFSDHLNGMPENPLRGPNDDSVGPRFLDLSQAYDSEFRAHARSLARKLGVRAHEGVYVSLPGPNYETPAEVKMWQRLGADAVGMSTVPEVLVARHQGMRVAAIAVISNIAVGLDTNIEHVSHEDVVTASGKAAVHLGTIFSSLLLSD